MLHNKKFIFYVLFIGIILRLFFSLLWGPYQKDFNGIIYHLHLQQYKYVCLIVLSLLSIILPICCYFIFYNILGKNNSEILLIILSIFPPIVQISAQGFLEPYIMSLYALLIFCVISFKKNILISSVLVSGAVIGIIILKPNLWLIIPIYKFFLLNYDSNLLNVSFIMLSLFIFYCFPILAIKTLKNEKYNTLLVLFIIAPLTIAVYVSEAFRLTEGGSLKGDIIRYSISALIPILVVIMQKFELNLKKIIYLLVIFWISFLPIYILAPRYS